MNLHSPEFLHLPPEHLKLPLEYFNLPDELQKHFSFVSPEVIRNADILRLFYRIGELKRKTKESQESSHPDTEKLIFTDVINVAMLCNYVAEGIHQAVGKKSQVSIETFFVPGTFQNPLFFLDEQKLWQRFESLRGKFETSMSDDHEPALVEMYVALEIIQTATKE